MKNYTPRFRQQRDSNHETIADALQYYGCIIADLAEAGGGVPDLMVGYRGIIFLVEVKSPVGALSPKQRAFFDKWIEYPALVLRTVDDVRRVMRYYGMRTIQRLLIGRHWYRVDVGDSGRWMFVREKGDDEEDEVVTRGTMRNPTRARVLETIRDELVAISEELENN